MFWSDRKSYKNTLAILKKEAELTPMFFELKRFIEGEFGITVYNITYEPYGIFNKPKKGFLNYGKRMKLNFCISKYEEFDKMMKRTQIGGEEINGRPSYRSNAQSGGGLYDVDANGRSVYRVSFDEQKQAIILAKFFELAEKYGYAVGAKAGEIWVDYQFSFLYDYMTAILNKIKRKTRKGIMQKYKKEAGIEQIDTDGGFIVVVFYRTDAQKAINEENGISDAIRKEYFSAVKKVDELGLYKEEYIAFDSKENLDRNYDGSTQMYFR
jgi:hypothetical protein